MSSRNVSAVKVCVRVRPTASFAQDNLILDTQNNVVTIIAPEESEGENSNRTSTFKYSYDSVLHNAGQSHVYDALANDVVRGALDGANGTIFAYGQTGSGKTFTMVGDTKVYAHRGIIPRAIGDIFSEIESREAEYSYKVKVSYLEIYNDGMFDLLRTDEKTTLTILDDSKRGGKGIEIKGLTKVEIRSEEDALALLFQGDDLRTTAKHSMNEKSNRSHCIYTIHIEQQARLDSHGKARVSKLNLVDLAGSERQKNWAPPEEMIQLILRESQTSSINL